MNLSRGDLERGIVYYLHKNNNAEYASRYLYNRTSFFKKLGNSEVSILIDGVNGFVDGEDFFNSPITEKDIRKIIELADDESDIEKAKDLWLKVFVKRRAQALKQSSENKQSSERSDYLFKRLEESPEKLDDLIQLVTKFMGEKEGAELNYQLAENLVDILFTDNISRQKKLLANIITESTLSRDVALKALSPFYSQEIDLKIIGDKAKIEIENTPTNSELERYSLLRNREGILSRGFRRALNKRVAFHFLGGNWGAGRKGRWGEKLEGESCLSSNIFITGEMRSTQRRNRPGESNFLSTEGRPLHHVLIFEEPERGAPKLLLVSLEESGDLQNMLAQRPQMQGGRKAWVLDPHGGIVQSGREHWENPFDNPTEQNRALRFAMIEALILKGDYYRLSQAAYLQTFREWSARFNEQQLTYYRELFNRVTLQPTVDRSYLESHPNLRRTLEITS